MEKKTVLIIDNDQITLTRAREQICPESFDVIGATGLAPAMEVLAFRLVHIVFCAFRLSQESGIEVLQRVKERYPLPVRVMLADDVGQEIVREMVNRGEIYRILQNPWQPHELMDVVHQCMRYYELRERNQQLLIQVQTQNEALKHFNQQLETLVQERTQMLRVSQEILENLLIPVIGISADYLIVMTNAAARELFKHVPQLSAGAALEHCLPAAARKLIDDCFSRGQPTQTRIAIDGVDWRMTAQPLFVARTIKGCTMYFFSGCHE